MKKTRLFLYIALTVCFLAFAAWGICETAGSEYYNYEGHIVDIREENGNTVITALNGDLRSDFTIKWYTKKKLETSDNKLEIGDLVLLTTTHFSDTNIKKMCVHDGFIYEGKLVYVNEVDGAFMLYQNPVTKTKHIVHIIPFENRVINGKQGETIRAYWGSWGVPHTVPPNLSDLSLLVNCTEKIADAAAFDEDELALIESLHYTIKENAS